MFDQTENGRDGSVAKQVDGTSVNGSVAEPAPLSMAENTLGTRPQVATDPKAGFVAGLSSSFEVDLVDLNWSAITSDPDALQSLGASLKVLQINDIIVSPKSTAGKHGVIAGNRRCAAAALAANIRVSFNPAWSWCHIEREECNANGRADLSPHHIVSNVQGSIAAIPAVLPKWFANRWLVGAVEPLVTQGDVSHLTTGKSRKRSSAGRWRWNVEGVIQKSDQQRLSPARRRHPGGRQGHARRRNRRGNPDGEPGAEARA